MDFNELLNAIPEANHVKIRQPRLWALTVFQTPDWLKERHPAIDLIEVNGQYLIGYNYQPRVGEVFPYLGHIWRVCVEPIQFPARFKSRGQKRPPLVLTEYVEPYQDETQMLIRLLELSTNS